MRLSVRKRDQLTAEFSLFSTCVFSNYNAVDTASAVAIALMTFGTMYPMSVYSGKVLLQVGRVSSSDAPIGTHSWY